MRTQPDPTQLSPDRLYGYPMVSIVTEPAEVTADWLSEVLNVRVKEITAHEPIGTGQMSRNFRFEFIADGLSSVVLKVPAEDKSLRELAATVYEREVRFYADLASLLPCRTPACFFAAITQSGGDFTLVLEDLAPAQQGDQIAGCTPAQAGLALKNLALLHAPTWNDSELTAHLAPAPQDNSILGEIYPLAHTQFMERYSTRLMDHTADVLEALVPHVVAWLNGTHDPFTLTHADYRLDNLLFTADSAAAVDWQTIRIGSPGQDVAYFLGNSLPIETRRENEDTLLKAYLDALFDYGVTGYDLDQLKADCVLGAWSGPFTAVLGAFAATDTERGDEMFIVMADRSAAQILDQGGRPYL
ncbi:MAG: phosphotransferase [Acidimicrobiaceae bacterium]|nr:phosphotransferase [Acidimicrobiaceae bacterium]MYC41535.1 phosphotransferase [Acidimicrobiaceae bacterium]